MRREAPRGLVAVQLKEARLALGLTGLRVIQHVVSSSALATLEGAGGNELSHSGEVGKLHRLSAHSRVGQDRPRLQPEGRGQAKGVGHLGGSADNAQGVPHGRGQILAATLDPGGEVGGQDLGSTGTFKGASGASDLGDGSLDLTVAVLEGVLCMGDARSYGTVGKDQALEE